MRRPMASVFPRCNCVAQPAFHPNVHSAILTTMDRSTYFAVLSMMTPEDLYPSWRWIDLMERSGEMELDEANRWKEGIFGLMLRWGLEPDQVVATEHRAFSRFEQ